MQVNRITNNLNTYLLQPIVTTFNKITQVTRQFSKFFFSILQDSYNYASVRCNPTTPHPTSPDSSVPIAPTHSPKLDFKVGGDDRNVRAPDAVQTKTLVRQPNFGQDSGGDIQAAVAASTNTYFQHMRLEKQNSDQLKKALAASSKTFTSENQSEEIVLNSATYSSSKDQLELYKHLKIDVNNLEQKDIRSLVSCIKKAREKNSNSLLSITLLKNRGGPEQTFIMSEAKTSEGLYKKLERWT